MGAAIRRLSNRAGVPLQPAVRAGRARHMQPATPTTGFLRLQAAAGNRAIARALGSTVRPLAGIVQRTEEDVAAYGPGLGGSMHPTFRAAHTAPNRPALDARAEANHDASPEKRRNTTIVMAAEHARAEVQQYLRGLPAGAAAQHIAQGTFQFETDSQYAYVVTEMQDPDGQGDRPVVIERGLGRLTFRAQWIPAGPGGYFQIYHYEPLPDLDPPDGL